MEAPDTTLRIACTWCEAPVRDDYEVFDLDTTARLRCEACERAFFFRFFECERCGHETVASWRQAPDDAAIDALTCTACGHAPGAMRESDRDDPDVG